MKYSELQDLPDDGPYDTMQERSFYDPQFVLTKAIEKAIAGGLTGYWKKRYESCVELDELEYLFHENEESDPRLLIFNHEFAKALWPSPPPMTYGEVRKKYTGNTFLLTDPVPWRDHLQAMVVAPDAIQYLGEHL